MTSGIQHDISIGLNPISLAHSVLPDDGAGQKKIKRKKKSCKQIRAPDVAQGKSPV